MSESEVRHQQAAALILAAATAAVVTEALEKSGNALGIQGNNPGVNTAKPTLNWKSRKAPNGHTIRYAVTPHGTYSHQSAYAHSKDRYAVFDAKKAYREHSASLGHHESSAAADAAAESHYAQLSARIGRASSK